jgi:hypothetical protein
VRTVLVAGSSCRAGVLAGGADKEREDHAPLRALRLVLGGRGVEPVTALLPFAIAGDRGSLTGAAVTRARA